MSRPSCPNAAHSQPPDSRPVPGIPDRAEFAALAEKLQEAAHGLLLLQRHPGRTANAGIEPGCRNAAEGTGQEREPHETRCYRIPGYILDEEREMLELHKAENWQELFSKAHDRLYATVLLMGRISAEDVIDGFTVSLIAENLMIPLTTLRKLCSLIADFHLVHKEKAAS